MWFLAGYFFSTVMRKYQLYLPLGKPHTFLDRDFVSMFPGFKWDVDIYW